jgi:hypothetical protein
LISSLLVAVVAEPVIRVVAVVAVLRFHEEKSP